MMDTLVGVAWDVFLIVGASSLSAVCIALTAAAVSALWDLALFFLGGEGVVMKLREYNVWSDWDRELDNMRAYNADEVDELLGSIRAAVDELYAAWTARGHNDGTSYVLRLSRARGALNALLGPAPASAAATDDDDDDAPANDTAVVHQCPPTGSGTMPCCGRLPFDRMSDRMTLDPDLVTCRGALDALLPPAATADDSPPDDCGGEHLEDGCGCKVCREGPSA